MSSRSGATTQFVTSADGTRIAYQVDGTGPPLVLVDGGLSHRRQGVGSSLRPLLSDSFAVHTYDRRGRGESGPGSSPYDVQREVEDLAAVISVSGTPVHVWAHSAGAALALEAARQGVPIERMVCYEAPFLLDDGHPADDPEFVPTLEGLLAEGKRGEAVTEFFTLMEVPAVARVLVRLTPIWRKLTAVAHTLPYEFAILGPLRRQEPLPDGYYTSVEADTLMITGTKSYPYMQRAQPLVAAALPHGRCETLEGQTHDPKPRAVAPLILRHLQQRTDR